MRGITVLLLCLLLLGGSAPSRSQLIDVTMAHGVLEPGEWEGIVSPNSTRDTAWKVYIEVMDDGAVRGWLTQMFNHGDGWRESSFFRNFVGMAAAGRLFAYKPGIRSSSEQVEMRGWYQEEAAGLMIDLGPPLVGLLQPKKR
jgi:hypothetical protein